jgi:hypothetical protein
MALTGTLTPGKQFAATEKVTIAKLNQLGQPTIAITGPLSGLSNINSVAEVTKNFTCSDFANDYLDTTAAHAITTNGQRVTLTTTGTLPGGLTESTDFDYYARSTGASQLTLHSSYADALANTNRVNITSAGSGTHTLAYTALATGQALVLNPSTSKWENGIVAPASLPEMALATASTPGTRGAVPQPPQNTAGYYLDPVNGWTRLPVTISDNAFNLYMWNHFQ